MHTKINSAPRFLWVICLVAGLFVSACAQTEHTIAEIQGEKARSPFVDQQVKVRGIVTARTRNGIFIQTPDDRVDGNPLTSEGLMVYIGQNGSFDGAIGDMVEAVGTVQEFMPRSESYGFTVTELGKR